MQTNPLPSLRLPHILWMSQGTVLFSPWFLGEVEDASSTVLDTVKEDIVCCNVAESSNPCLGKAAQYWEGFLWERKSSFAELQTTCGSP